MANKFIKYFFAGITLPGEKQCERRNLWLGAPTFLLSALIGTSVFSTLAADPATWAKILVGLTSMLVAILAALQSIPAFFGTRRKTSY